MAIAVAVFIAATLVRLALEPWLHNAAPYTTYFPAIIVAAWYGGLTLGLATAVLSAGMALFLFVGPTFHLEGGLSNVIGVILSTSVGVVAAVLTNALRDARGRAEEAHEQIQGVLESIEDGFAAVDRNWRFTHLSGNGEKLIRRSAESLIGKSIWTEFPDLRGTPTETAYKKAMFERVPAFSEEYYEPLGRWFEGRYFPTKDGGFSILFRDITARKEFEVQLSRRIQDFEALFSAIPVAVAVSLDSRGEDVRVNPALARILGTELNTNVSKTGPAANTLSFRFLRDGRELAPEEFPIQRAQREGRVVEMIELEVERADGVVTPIYGSSVPLFDEAGNVRGSISAYIDLTEQRRSAEALRSREQELRTLLAALPDVVCRFDRDLRFRYVSPAVEVFTEFRPEQLIGKTHLEAGFPPELAERLRARLQRLFETGERNHIEFDYPQPGGGIRNLIAIGVPERDRNGEVTSALTIVRDVSERTQAEMALRESERKLRRIFETAGVSIWEQDFSAVKRRLNSLRAAGVSDLAAYISAHPELVPEAVDLVRVSDVNAATLRMFGAASKDQLLPSLQVVFVPQTLEVFKDQLLAIWENRIRLESETVVRTLAGEQRNVVFTMELPPDDPDLRSVLVSLMDATELKKAEELARASEERQRRAMEAGKVGLWEWDIRNNRVTWSDYVYELHGLEYGSFDGTVEAFASLVHPADRAHVSALLQKALSGEGDYEAEFRAVRPDGQTRWIATSGRVTFDEHRNPIWMHGAALNTTDRKESEEALMRSNAELEEFAYVASHDMQEPLRMVNIYTQLLIRRHVDPANQDAAQYAEYISTGVHRMERLIRDLLSYSRTIHLDFQIQNAANLSDSLAQALSVLEPRVTETAAIITHSALPVVRGDAAQLAQVLQNLISNSLKYSKAGVPPQIEIAAERRDADWVVSVKDNGIGFEPQYSERIFGLFKRLHKDEYPGTGLGLAICKRTIDRHGGRIWAESEPGVGSVFYFSLPASGGS